MRRTLTIILLLLAAPLVHAEHDHETLFNKVSLQAEAQGEAPNDEMTVVLSAEQQGSDAAALAERVNENMTWALGLAGKVAAVRAETQSYSTWPMYDDGVITGWRVRQELQLKSQDFARLTELLGKLQERLQIVRMGFSPTAETRRQYENELITEAMQAFKERVAVIQQSMGNSDYRIIELHVGAGGSSPPIRMMAAEASTLSMARSAPVVEGGTSEVTVTVSGSVQFY